MKINYPACEIKLNFDQIYATKQVNYFYYINKFCNRKGVSQK